MTSVIDENNWNGITPSGMRFFKLDSECFNRASHHVKTLLEKLAEKKDPNFQQLTGTCHWPGSKLVDFVKNGNVLRGPTVKDYVYRHCKHLKNVVNDVEFTIKRELGISQEDLDQFGIIKFVELGPDTGIPLHVENIRRVRGPIFLVPFGENITLDMAPTLVSSCIGKHGFIIRTEVESSCICLLSGDSRYDWSYGVPAGSCSSRFFMTYSLEECLLDILSGVSM